MEEDNNNIAYIPSFRKYVEVWMNNEFIGMNNGKNPDVICDFRVEAECCTVSGVQVNVLSNRNTEIKNYYVPYPTDIESFRANLSRACRTCLGVFDPKRCLTYVRLAISHQTMRKEETDILGWSPEHQVWFFNDYVLHKDGNCVLPKDNDVIFVNTKNDPPPPLLLGPPVDTNASIEALRECVGIYLRIYKKRDLAWEALTTMGWAFSYAGANPGDNHPILLMHGTGGRGKTTVLDFVKELFGISTTAGDWTKSALYKALSHYSQVPLILDDATMSNSGEREEREIMSILKQSFNGAVRVTTVSKDVARSVPIYSANTLPALEPAAMSRCVMLNYGPGPQGEPSDETTLNATREQLAPRARKAWYVLSRDIGLSGEVVGVRFPQGLISRVRNSHTRVISASLNLLRVVQGDEYDAGPFLEWANTKWLPCLQHIQRDGNIVQRIFEARESRDCPNAVTFVGNKWRLNRVKIFAELLPDLKGNQRQYMQELETLCGPVRQSGPNRFFELSQEEADKLCGYPVSPPELTVFIRPNFNSSKRIFG